MNSLAILDKVPLPITRAMGKTSLTLKKYAPELFVMASIFSGLAAIAYTVKGSIGVEEEYLSFRKEVDEIKEAKTDADEDLYPTKDYQHDLGLAYWIFAKKMSARYWPTATLTTLSIGTTLAAHGIMRERNAAYLAGWAAVQQAFNSYRTRVVTDHGEEVDKLYFYGGESTKSSRQVIDPETGKKKKVSEDHVVFQDGTPMPSPYARKFGEYSKEWKGIPSIDNFTVSAGQNYFNQRLQKYGHVFLNEVYDWFDIPMTQEGAVVGWLLFGNGDGYIDFSVKFKNEYALEEEYILLDFNVDGPIIEALPTNND